MKKDSSFRNFIKRFKELWAIPRYRSMIKLGLWVIFFIFVSLYVNSYEYVGNKNTDNEIEEKLAIEKFKDLDNYSFTISYTDKDNTIITGKNYEERMLIILNDQTYYQEEDTIYNIEDEYRSNELEESPFPSNDFSLQPEELYKLIKMGELDEETKKIQDNTIIKKYIVISQDTLLKYEVPEEERDKASIIITTYEKNEQINKVTIDLTNIKKLDGSYDEEDYIITIDYSDIDKVLAFAYYEKTEDVE